MLKVLQFWLSINLVFLDFLASAVGRFIDSVLIAAAGQSIGEVQAWFVHIRAQQRHLLPCSSPCSSHNFPRIAVGFMAVELVQSKL